MKRDRSGRFLSADQADEQDREAAETLAQDVGFATETYMEEVLPALLDKTYDGPALVVLSCGYAEVWSDGEVTSGGRVLFTLECAE